MTDPVATSGVSDWKAYFLQGDGISFAYYPEGTATRSPAGLIHVTYRDSDHKLSFVDPQSFTDLPELGFIVTISIADNDLHATTFSVVIPQVAAPPDSHGVSIETFGITAEEHKPSRHRSQPQRKTYAVTSLSGTATQDAPPPFDFL